MKDPIIDLEYRYVPHESTLYTRPVMDTNVRRAVLDRNQRLRNSPGSQNDLSFGRQTLSIPLLDHHRLMKKYPDMQSDDKATRQRAMAKFMASSESAPYKVR